MTCIGVTQKYIDGLTYTREGEGEARRGDPLTMTQIGASPSLAQTHKLILTYLGAPDPPRLRSRPAHTKAWQGPRLRQR